MTNSPENLPSSPAEELRIAVLSRALSTTALTGDRERGDTIRHIEILPEDDDILDLRVSTFEEGSQDDGAIVQVSFETHDISEAHLILKDDGMSYEEHSINGAYVSLEQVDDVTAAKLLSKLSPIIEE